MSTDTSANRTWQTLSTQADSMATLNQLFSQQSNRGLQYRVAACDMIMDFSKQKIDEAVLSNLIKLANERELAQEIHRLMTGEIVNDTEHRPALHTALRQPQGEQFGSKVSMSLSRCIPAYKKRKSWLSGFVMGSGVVILVRQSPMW